MLFDLLAIGGGLVCDILGVGGCSTPVKYKKNSFSILHLKVGDLVRLRNGDIKIINKVQVYDEHPTWRTYCFDDEFYLLECNYNADGTSWGDNKDIAIVEYVREDNK